MDSQVMSGKNYGLKTVKYLAALAPLALLFFLSCSKKDVAPAVAKGVALKANPAGAGSVIVDDLGNTLYFFAQDYAGLNTCQGDCAAKWITFYVSNISIGAGLDQADFGEITLTGGGKQTTYKGWPLYRYSGDAKPGDMTGDNFNHVWFFAKPDYSVMIAVNPTSPRKYLVAPNGRTLYTYDNDINLNVSTCTGSCSNTWPAFLKTTPNIVVPTFLSATDFGTTTGGQQFIYKGHLLYFNVGDVNRGDAAGLSNSAWHELDETKF